MTLWLTDLQAQQKRFSRIALPAALALALVSGSAASEPPAPLSADVDLAALSGPKKHQKRQNRPIKMGTSGGNINDFTLDPPFIQCCSGTLGSLVSKSGELFILSNNHVLAMSNQALVGDPVSQPGRLDTECRVDGEDHVGTLSGFKKLKFGKGRNRVDAAIAATDPGTVDPTGAMVGIGVPGNATVKPQVGMFVQKAGRTTGVRKGVIDLVNWSVIVEYTTECSGDAEILEALFVKQFRIVSTNNKSFSNSGDSGAAILEDREDCPSHVGLLFAGNTSLTVANPIGKVLKEVKKMAPKGKVELVGCTRGASASTLLKAESALPELDGKALRVAERVQSRVDKAMLELEGVRGMGIGRSTARPGQPVFKVLIDERRPEAAASVPKEIDGIPVEIEMTDPIRAFGCRL